MAGDQESFPDAYRRIRQAVEQEHNNADIQHQNMLDLEARVLEQTAAMKAEQQALPSPPPLETVDYYAEDALEDLGSSEPIPIPEPYASNLCNVVPSPILTPLNPAGMDTSVSHQVPVIVPHWPRGKAWTYQERNVRWPGELRNAVERSTMLMYKDEGGEINMVEGEARLPTVYPAGRCVAVEDGVLVRVAQEFGATKATVEALVAVLVQEWGEASRWPSQEALRDAVVGRLHWLGVPVCATEAEVENGVFPPGQGPFDFLRPCPVCLHIACKLHTKPEPPRRKEELQALPPARDPCPCHNDCYLLLAQPPSAPRKATAQRPAPPAAAAAPPSATAAPPPPPAPSPAAAPRQPVSNQDGSVICIDVSDNEQGQDDTAAGGTPTPGPASASHGGTAATAAGGSRGGRGGSGSTPGSSSGDGPASSTAGGTAASGPNSNSGRADGSDGGRGKHTYHGDEEEEEEEGNEGPTAANSDSLHPASARGPSQGLPTGGANSGQDPSRLHGQASTSAAAGQASTSAVRGPTLTRQQLMRQWGWIRQERDLFASVAKVFLHDPCTLAGILPGRTCRNVHRLLQAPEHPPPNGPLATPAADNKAGTSNSKGPAADEGQATNGKRRGPALRPGSRRSDVVTLVLKNYKQWVGKRELPAWQPCWCEGPCDPDTCTCVQQGLFCDRRCGCYHPEDPCLYVAGCTCAGPCSSIACPCRSVKRECDPLLCRSCTPAKCSYMDLSLCRHKNVSVRPSTIPGAGYGVFTLDACKAGDCLGQYTGEILPRQESDRRAKAYDRGGCSYLFVLDNETDLDAMLSGNELRYANHADPGNAVPEVRLVDGERQVGLFARVDIKAGEEILYNYGYSAQMVDHQTYSFASTGPTSSGTGRGRKLV